jgi:hypothetical protein
MKQRNLTISNHALKRYADLDYDEWYAIAEFVDNSLHSYLEKKLTLKKIGVNHCEVKIAINKEEGKEFIEIFDNAGGIHENEFDRLLTFGIKKEKAEYQLSEFGMGMKTAGIWLGNVIEIETKNYLDEKCYKITIDLNKLDEGKEVQIKEVTPSSNLKCYTKVRISDLNRSLSRKKKKIQESMASIYRKFIEDGSLKITFEDIELDPFSFEFLKDAENEDVVKLIEISLSNGKKCTGWIGILLEGYTKIGGFSVYKHNRLIQGYPESSWRPAEVFGGEGGSNTLKNQRLIGELDMSQFKVAHTKNKFNFQGDEEYEFRSQLGEQCKEIASEANKSGIGKKSIKSEMKTINSQIAKTSIESFVQNPVNTNLESISFVAPTIKTNTPKKVKEIYAASDEAYLNLPLKEQEGIEKNIKVFMFNDPKFPHVIMDDIDDKLIICLNLGHPYFSDIRLNGTAEREREFIMNCVFDVISEIHNEIRYGGFKPEDIRLTKNLLLTRWMEHINS